MRVLLQKSVPKCLNKTGQILSALKFSRFVPILILLCFRLIANPTNTMDTLFFLLHIIVKIILQDLYLKHKMKVVVHREKFNTIYSGLFRICHFRPCESFLTRVHQLPELHLHTCGSVVQSTSRTFLHQFKLVHLALKQKWYFNL